MKKLLLILLCLPMIGFGQGTYMQPIEDMNGDLIKNKTAITSNNHQMKMTSGISLTIINTIPSPIPYPHDITFDGEDLWVAGYNSSIVRISTIDGTVLQTIATNLSRPYGLAFDGQYLWVADADIDVIQKVDPLNGNVIATINAPASFPSYSAGLAFDGTNILQNDQRENILATPGDSTFIINQTGSLVNAYEAKGDFPGGLTFDGTFLWSTDNDSNEIHKIDLSTFSTIATYDAPGGDFPLGLAFDGQYLWACNNDSDSLYQLVICDNTVSYDTLSVGASIVWNGMPLNVSGDYSVTLINSEGCDSIANLNLTVTTTGILEIANNKSNLIKITDMLGQETPYKRNTPLFYIYKDGTVEKRIVIEQ